MEVGDSISQKSNNRNVLWRSIKNKNKKTKQNGNHAVEMGKEQHKNQKGTTCE